MNALADAAPRKLDDAALRAWPLPQPQPDGDKETRGRVVIVAGGREIPGAAILSAEAALRAGAGKVLIVTAASVATAVAIAVPEARVVALRETPAGGIAAGDAPKVVDLALEARALLIGPGLQEDAPSLAFVRAVVQGVTARGDRVTTILDAAAMRAVKRSRSAAAPMLITPHAGEMAQLTGIGKNAVLEDPMSVASDMALRWNAVVALKGAITCIAHPDGRRWQHDEAGNIGLATSGSGDVLAGIIAGFAARGAELAQAAAWGVAIHARAGECVARRLGGLGFFARELAVEVPALLESFCGGESEY